MVSGWVSKSKTGRSTAFVSISLRNPRIDFDGHGRSFRLLPNNLQNFEEWKLSVDITSTENHHHEPFRPVSFHPKAAESENRQFVWRTPSRRLCPSLPRGNRLESLQFGSREDFEGAGFGGISQWFDFRFGSVETRGKWPLEGRVGRRIRRDRHGECNG